MFTMQRFKIGRHERGLRFRDGEFEGILEPGRHWIVDPLRKVRVDVVSVRDVWLAHNDLDVIARSGALDGQARILDLKDSERALVWVDGRFDGIFAGGLAVIWTVFADVRVEIVDASEQRFEHECLPVILAARGSMVVLDRFNVDAGHVGLYFRNGSYVSTLDPGVHAFWKNAGKVTLHLVDLRESVLDVAGQEIITADKVSLRLNAVVTYRVTDPLRSVMTAGDARQALYREAQLALRAVIGSRDLDTLLTGKDAAAEELDTMLRARASELGIEVISLGIRDVILPGEMKVLMNRVTEAKKAAEANLISRREETAAMRSQANTAKILESNTTLMRLRELEVLEKIAGSSKLNVVLGEKGLADRVVNLL